MEIFLKITVFSSVWVRIFGFSSSNRDEIVESRAWVSSVATSIVLITVECLFFWQSCQWISSQKANWFKSFSCWKIPTAKIKRKLIFFNLHVFFIIIFIIIYLPSTLSLILNWSDCSLCFPIESCWQCWVLLVCKTWSSECLLVNGWHQMKVFEFLNCEIREFCDSVNCLWLVWTLLSKEIVAFENFETSWLFVSSVTSCVFWLFLFVEINK